MAESLLTESWSTGSTVSAASAATSSSTRLPRPSFVFGEVAAVNWKPMRRPAAWSSGRDRRLTEGATSSLSGLLGGSDSELTAKKVYEAAVEGDDLALEIIDETARWLGIGITTLVHTLDPGSIVLGGAMNFGGPDSPIGQRFLQGISEEFRSPHLRQCLPGDDN